MFLTELIETLRDEQTKRGNVPLSQVHVMHHSTLLVSHHDEVPEPKAPQKIDITGMHEDQVDELRAEFPDAEFFSRAPETSTAPGERCNVIDTSKGKCMLEIGHDGEHVWTNPEALTTEQQIEKDKGWPAGSVSEIDGKLIARCTAYREERGGRCTREPAHAGDHHWPLPEQIAPPPNALTQVMEDAAAKLPTEVPDLEGKGKEVRTPCPQFDENKVGCFLPFGHEGDHVFVHSIGQVTTSGSASAEGGETVTIPIPDTPKE